MKLFNKPLFLVGALAVSLGIGSLAYQGSQNILAIESQMQTRQTRPSLQPYNGEKLYAEVFQYIRDGHFNLGDATKRDAFVTAWQTRFAGKKVKDIPNFALKSWEGKFDDTLVFAQPETADHAIDLMLLSMGFLHDSYMKQDDVDGMGTRSDPSFAGVGIEVAIRDLMEARRALIAERPKDPKDKAAMDAWMAKAKVFEDEFAKISIAHPFFVPTQPDEGSPGFIAGLRKGDIVLEVAQDVPAGKTLEWVTLVGKTTDEAVAMIRGKINTKVHLKVGRVDSTTGETKVSVYTVTRGKIVQKVVSYHDLGDCISYVSLNDFMSQYARKELKSAFDKSAVAAKACNGQGGIVLNFRDNGGGDIRIAYALEAMLMKTGTALVTKQRTPDGYDHESYTLLEDHVLQTVTAADGTTQERLVPRNVWNPALADQNPNRMSDSDIFTKTILPKGFKIVVLINGGSASASEILSGTLQGEHVATLMGTPSFGKGEGQTIIPLMNGGMNNVKQPARMLRMTSFEFLPSGVSMNHVGVIPDIVVEYQPAPTDKDYIWDSQVTAAKAELLRQLAAQQSQDELRGKMAIEKRKKHDSMFNQKRIFIETGEAPSGPVEE